MDALACAAADAAPVSPVAPAMWTTAEVVALKRAPRKLLDFLVERWLLRPLRGECPACRNGTAMLALHADASYTDGYRLQCGPEGHNFSVRHDSIAGHFQLHLVDLAILIAYFDVHLGVHQAAQLTGVHRHTVSKLYFYLRVRCRDYIDRHPIVFPINEIIELDEFFAGALRIPPNAEGQGGEWPPILGMIGRESHRVVVEIVPDKSKRSAENFTTPHLPPNGATIITDKAQYFRFLKEHHHQILHQIDKEKKGSAVWPHSKVIIRGDQSFFWAHTNTIEGYWSQLRTWLHASHGWPADYLPLFLSECMFRSLHLPLTTILAPVPDT